MRNDEHDSKAEVRPLLQNHETPAETSFLHMLFFGSLVAAPCILSGISVTFSAIALPQMQVTLAEASTFGSLHALGSVGGAVLMGLFIDRYGRRKALIFGMVPSVIGWTFIAVSSSITVIFIGKFLAGIVAGCIYIGIVYAAESIVVNHHHLRNSISTWTLIALAIGGLLNYTLGRLMPYQRVAAVAAVLSFILLGCICLFIPESPRWLFEGGQIGRAKRSEKRLSIHQPFLTDVDENTTVKHDFKGTWQRLKTGCQKLKRKDVYKPLVISVIWNIFSVLSGGPCIVAYLINILHNYPVTYTLDFHEMVQQELNGYDLGIVTGVLNLIAIIMTSALVPHMGTKKLFSITSVGLALGMVGLGLALTFQDENKENNFWRATQIISVWLTTFCFTLGVVSIPTIVCGEMFPPDATGFLSVSSISYCLLEGILLKSHLYFYATIGPSLYFIYAAVNICSAIFTIIFVPETVGKSQEEVRNSFMN